MEITTTELRELLAHFLQCGRTSSCTTLKRAEVNACVNAYLEFLASVGHARVVLLDEPLEQLASFCGSVNLAVNLVGVVCLIWADGGVIEVRHSPFAGDVNRSIHGHRHFTNTTTKKNLLCLVLRELNLALGVHNRFTIKRAPEWVCWLHGKRKSRRLLRLFYKLTG